MPCTAVCIFSFSPAISLWSLDSLALLIIPFSPFISNAVIVTPANKIRLQLLLQ